MTLIYILDLVGVFAFAVFGAHKAIAARFDLFGVLVCAALTALGGGAIREVVLQATPGFLADQNYAIVVGLGVIFAIITHRHFAKIMTFMLAVDALGLAVFAYVGALRADQAGFGLLAMVFFAVVTSVGGGIMADLVSRYKPEALYKDFYPLAAIVLAAGYYLLGPMAQKEWAALALIAAAFAVRVVSMRLKITLWKPAGKPRPKLWLWRKARVNEG